MSIEVTMGLRSHSFFSVSSFRDRIKFSCCAAITSQETWQNRSTSVSRCSTYTTRARMRSIWKRSMRFPSRQLWTGCIWPCMEVFRIGWLQLKRSTQWIGKWSRVMRHCSQICSGRTQPTTGKHKRLSMLIMKIEASLSSSVRHLSESYSTS